MWAYIFFHVCITTVPNKPGGPVSSSTNETITVQTSGGCDNSGPRAVTYVFQYKETSSEVWKGIETRTSSVTIPSLQAATTYNIRAYCFNSVGRSPISTAISHTTKRGTGMV